MDTLEAGNDQSIINDQSVMDESNEVLLDKWDFAAVAGYFIVVLTVGLMVNKK